MIMRQGANVILSRDRGRMGFFLDCRWLLESNITVPMHLSANDRVLDVWLEASSSGVAYLVGFEASCSA